MGFENSAGLSVYNHYGPRKADEDEVVGRFKTYGEENELVIEVTGEQIGDVDTNGTSRGLSINKLPAGAKIIEAVVDVEEVFTMTGTSPTIQVGTEGSEATNNFEISEAQAEATGVYVITTFNGTWDAELAADTQIGFDLGGTTPTLADSGRARITIRYVKVK